MTSRGAAWAEGLWRPTLLYILLTLVLTWPVAARFGEAVAGFEARDSLQYTWSLWWSARAFQSGQSPADVSLLNHPWGGDHSLLDVTPMLDWLALPLGELLTPTQVYNALFLASFVLNGLAMYLLARELVGDSLAGIVAGLVYAFSPHRMGHALAGHLTQLAAWWFPLAALYVHRSWKRPSVPNALIAGILLASSLMVSLVHTAYFVAPLICLAATYVAVADRRQLSSRHLGAMACILSLAALLVLPKYGPFLWRSWREGLDLSAPGVVANSTDGLAHVLPSPYHPLWGRWLSQIGIARRLIPEPNELEHMAYLGVVPMALGFVSLRRRWKVSRFWVFVGAAALWLSRGPVLVVGGRDTGLPQPYSVLMRLPFYRWGRTPERFNELVIFSLSMLVAHGLAALRLRPSWIAILAGIMLLERVVLWPFPTGTPAAPAELGGWATADPGVVLDLPISKRQIGNLAMYYQTTHEQPIVGGYIHRELAGSREYEKAMDAALTGQAPGAARMALAEEVRALLAGLGIRHVLLHRQFVTPAWIQEQSERLESALGQPTTDLGTALVYAVGPGSMRSKLGIEPLATYGDTIALLGVDVHESGEYSGQSLSVTCTWRALNRPAVDYTVFVHLLDDHGAKVTQHDGQPLGGNWPTTLWAPGQTLIDVHTLLLDRADDVEPLTLAIGLYDQESGERLEARSDLVPLSENAAIIPIKEQWPVGLAPLGATQPEVAASDARS